MIIMFGKRRIPIAPANEPSAPSADDLGVIFHVMPKVFLGKQADLSLIEKTAADTDVVIAPGAPSVEENNPAPSMSEQDVPPVVSPPSQTGKRLWALVIVVFVLFLLGSTYIFFTLPKKETPQPIATSTPSASVTPVATLSTSPSPSPVVGKVVQGIDTDSDGLTNVEEILYGTNFRNPDSDGDSFLDGNEVFHRYDPNGLAPSTLLDTGAVVVADAPEHTFTLYRPTSWKIVYDDATDTMSFLPGGQYTSHIKIHWISLAESGSLLSYVTMAMPEVLEQRYESFTTKEGYDAIALPDGRTVLIHIGNYVVSFSYVLADDLTIEFLQTFKMMVNSLHA
jgi:hypothetical protein